MPSKMQSQYGELLDAMFLELCDLIEQQSACRVQIEALSNDGQLWLAKTRYNQGSQTVSTAQIPTENSTDFQALARVHTNENKSKVSQMEYSLQRLAVDREEGFVEPLQWFSALAPSSLRLAADKFKNCVELVVESANIQREMVAVMQRIDAIKKAMAT